MYALIYYYFDFLKINTYRGAINKEGSRACSKYVITVVSFCYGLKQQNPGNYVSRKTEIVSVRVNVTLD